MKNQISTCPVSGLEREVEIIEIAKRKSQKACRLTAKVTRFKGGKEVKNKGLGPYGISIQINNTKESNSYDELIGEKNDSQIELDVIKWADERKMFDE